MRRTGLLWVAVGAIAIMISGCSKTEGTKPPSSEASAGRSGGVGTGGAGANLSDDEFVHDAALKNLAAVELSRVALGKATNLDVKSFAQRMIDDHSAAGRNLKSVVSGQPIAWPVQLDDKHGKIADELAKKEGGDFDREYMKEMVKGHQDLAAKLESRLDVASLADWKTAAAAAPTRKPCPSPQQCATCKFAPIRATTRSRGRSTSGRPTRIPSRKSISILPEHSRPRRIRIHDGKRVRWWRRRESHLTARFDQASFAKFLEKQIA